MSKQITMFDVFNAMPETSTAMFTSTRGGKSLGKKYNNNAVIEVLVDDETFQDFAFQKTYGHAKTGKSKKYFMFLSIDADEYEKTRAILNKKSTKKVTTQIKK